MRRPLGPEHQLFDYSEAMAERLAELFAAVRDVCEALLVWRRSLEEDSIDRWEEADTAMSRACVVAKDRLSQAQHVFLKVLEERFDHEPHRSTGDHVIVKVPYKPPHGEERLVWGGFNGASLIDVITGRTYDAERGVLHVALAKAFEPELAALRKTVWWQYRTMLRILLALEVTVTGSPASRYSGDRRTATWNDSSLSDEVLRLRRLPDGHPLN